MSDSISSVVSASRSLDAWAMMMEKETLLLRQVLENQQQTIVDLIDTAPTAPELADSGSIGTLLHATA
ncbi:MAG TPA: hypothetical protein VK104_10260 [Burkholderiaceae bacterium]|nr:hypothetical protein [Burkholderiaceae bacterium]